MSETKECKKECFKSKTGGQALIEGVYMRGITSAAMACRLPDGTIDVEQWAVKNGKDTPWYRKTPFVRGCINFIANLIEGIRCTIKSAEKQITEDDEEEELSKFEQWLTDKFGDKLVTVIMIISVVIALAFSFVVFKGGPILVGNLIIKAGAAESARPIIEGLARLVLLVGYMYAISFMGSIKTTFMYHGAEHKSIACYEAQEELTVENARKFKRFHPRCGTSFLVLMLLVGMFVSFFIDPLFMLAGLYEGAGYLALRALVKLLLLPLIMGIGYELIKFAGRHDNIVTRIFSAPGLWLQRVTVLEPTDDMIECAIAAFKEVIPDDNSDKF